MEIILEKIGRNFINFFEAIGKFTQLSKEAFVLIGRLRFKYSLLIAEMAKIGVNSVPIVLIVTAFTGMVLAVQMVYGFGKFGAQSLVGGVVALSMARELAPILTGVVVAGRVGAAIAAEIGSMYVTEQVSALRAIGVDPVEYLVVPRVVAGLIMVPILSIFAFFIGIAGGYFVAVGQLGVASGAYFAPIFSPAFLKLTDFLFGVFKAVIFGGIITFIGCYKGFSIKGGTSGVGEATREAVVLSIIIIFIVNYFLSVVLF